MISLNTRWCVYRPPRGLWCRSQPLPLFHHLNIKAAEHIGTFSRFIGPRPKLSSARRPVFSAPSKVHAPAFQRLPDANECSGRHRGAGNNLQMREMFFHHLRQLQLVCGSSMALISTSAFAAPAVPVNPSAWHRHKTLSYQIYAGFDMVRIVIEHHHFHPAGEHKRPVICPKRPNPAMITRGCFRRSHRLHAPLH